MLRNDKERVVAELVERLKAADTLLVADYRGLTHAELDGVRSELLKLGARFAVAKNTLTKRAADEAGVDGLDEFLTGPTAIAFVSEGEAVAVAKVLADTARQTRRLELKGGLLSSKAITADEVRDLATLPPPEVLRGQLLGAIVGPVASIVGIFSAPLRDLVGVLEARIRQLESEGGAAETPVAAEAAAEAEEPSEVPPAAAEEAEAAPAETTAESEVSSAVEEAAPASEQPVEASEQTEPVDEDSGEARED
jgi:large subunit ribosomal protein L10